MTHHDRSPAGRDADEGGKRPFLGTPTGIALCVFLAVAGLLIWIEHRAHVLGALPWLLLPLLCLGMHFFMHRGHGDSHRHGGDHDAR